MSFAYVSGTARLPLNHERCSYGKIIALHADMRCCCHGSAWSLGRGSWSSTWSTSGATGCWPVSWRCAHALTAACKRICDRATTDPALPTPDLVPKVMKKFMLCCALQIDMFTFLIEPINMALRNLPAVSASCSAVLLPSCSMSKLL